MDALRRRAARVLTVSLVGTLGLSGAVALTAVPATADDAPPAQPLTLKLASRTATVHRYPGGGVNLSGLGVYLVANGGPVEFRTGRARYDQPFDTTLTTGQGGSRATRTLPTGLTTRVDALTSMLEVTLRDADGKVAFRQSVDFCSGSGARSRTDAPATSPYPAGCDDYYYFGSDPHPFAIGGVLGIQDGWAVPAVGDGLYGSLKKTGTYTATVRITKAYREVLGLSAAEAAVTVTVKVKKAAADDYEWMSAGAAQATAGAGALRPASAPKLTKAAVDPSLAPDLRALPAWGISLSRSKPKGAKTKHTYVDFGASVWNAGPSPLVVDGFRSSDELMDAYQYFFDADGRQIGSVPAGTMEWDARKGHTHWHFTDFARYELVDRDKKVVVKSGKEAFCLAPTEWVDLRVPNAEWHPDSVGLTTDACGGHDELALREVLPVGWADTYDQDRPGQSFDVTKVKAGIYYLKVTANPYNKLVEPSKDNNVSYRKIRIGGDPGGKRTLKVYAYQGIPD